MTSIATSSKTPRVVLLGASNLSLGWRTLMQVVCERWSGPLHVMTAHGMGRSYIGRSSFGLRSAPGILKCGLWPQLTDSGQAPPMAGLITDLGNDLIYGRSAHRIVEAVEEVIERLRVANPDCQITVTRPPIASVESLSVVRYRLFRTMIFPWCRLSLSEITEAAHELDEGVQQLSNVTIVSQQREWFGLDPIHVRRRYRKPAFTSFLASWPEGSPDKRAFQPRIGRPVMEQSWLAGWERRRLQPSTEAGGVSVSAW